MKKSILLASSIFFSLSAISSGHSKEVTKAKTLYTQALALEKEGKVTEALAKLKECMRILPSSATIYQKHATLSANAPKILYQQKVAALAKVNVPSIDLDNDSLDSALKKLIHVIEANNKKTGGKITTNVIILDPNKKLEKAKISFQLKNVPATVVMDEIMRHARADYKIEQYAFRITPNQ